MARKNQKNVLSSFTSLLKGNSVAIGYHQAQIEKLNRQLRSSKTSDESRREIREKIVYHNTQLDYFYDERARYSLTQAVCGDPIIVVR